ncbi:hypothetical protein [Ochrovirga pacifica]|uniref:hypothetical protein n=1 Tax=Ochrovirga pacifica TaxID=1042376 RepID=UPI0002559DC6|nr:hypothetical protein [Ochrovirga pacifica]
MKKVLLILVSLICSISYAQEFKFSKDLKAKNVTCIEKSGKQLTLFTEYDKKDKNYHISLLVLENGVNRKRGVYVTKDRLDLVSYHVCQNQLVLVLEVKKLSKSNKKKGYVRKKSEETRYKVVGYDLNSNRVDFVEKIFKKSKYKFATDTMTCFLRFENQQIHLISISDTKTIKTSAIKLDKDQMEALSYDVRSKLTIIESDKFKENIGVNAPRLFFTDKNIYITRDSYKFKKKSVVFKLTLGEGGVIKEGELKELGYPYGKTVKDLNSFLLNDTYYIVTRYKSELNLQVIDLINFNKSVKTIKLDSYGDNGYWAKGDVKKLAKKLTNIISPKVPSLMVRELEGTDKKLVVINDINKNTYYYHDNFHWQFHQQMMNQQHQRMMQNIQNQMMRNMQQMQQVRMNMPGGFRMVEFPLFVNLSNSHDFKLEFLVDDEGNVSKYNKEKALLKKYDYEKAHKELEDEIRIKVKKYKKEFVSIAFLEKYKIQYAYFDEYENRLLTGVLKLKEE